MADRDCANCGTQLPDDTDIICATCSYEMADEPVRPAKSCTACDYGYPASACSSNCR